MTTKERQQIKKACEVLREKVRLARFGTMDAAFDRRVQKEVGFYSESWIVPILDALEKGDFKLLNDLTHNDLGHSMHRIWPSYSALKSDR